MRRRTSTGSIRGPRRSWPWYSILPVDLDPRDGVAHPVEAADEGALAATGGADHGGDGVLADVHRDARERERLAVPDAQVLDREDGRAAGDLGERLFDRLLGHVDLHAFERPRRVSVSIAPFSWRPSGVGQRLVNIGCRTCERRSPLRRAVFTTIQPPSEATARETGARMLHSLRGEART